MIDLLDRYLQRLIRETGADAAVIWSRIGDATAGSVIATHPLGLLPLTTAWPTTDPLLSEVIHRDAAAVAGLVPTSLRLELPAPPTAALSLDLADPDLAVLLVWSDPPEGEELPSDLRLLVAEEISYAARLLSRQARFDRESQRLQAVVGDLTLGVVSVDHSLQQVTVNPAAAKLLNLPAGEVGETDFAAAMTAWEARALNRDDITSMGIRLLDDPGGVIDCTWSFNGSPSHVHVSSHAVHQGVFSGRVWVFEDVSQSAQALAASRAAQALLQATSDSMLDPQMLLEAVRNPDTGRVVDFIYREANPAACKDMVTTRDELIGRGVLELLPRFAESGLLTYYAHCLETGQPGALDDHPLDHDVQASSLRYDIRIAPAGKDLISLTFRDVTDRFRAAQSVADSEALLRANADSMLDPQVLMEAVRDPDGRVVDFRYISVNQATCSYLGLSESDLVGHTQSEETPNLEGSELHRRYVQCLQDGEPVVLDDYAFFNEILDDDRRYDIRAVRAGTDLLNLTWRDVTERFQAAQRIAASERQYRLLAENSTDIVCHIRDAAIVWVSPSIEPVLGAPPDYWIGREVFAQAPPEDVAEQVALMATALGGSEIKHRVRGIDLDGVAHWFDLRAKPFLDADGCADGVTATLRLVDDEVAAQQKAEEASKRQAEADARYRRFVDKSITATALLTPQGQFVEVNHAFCDYYGYDADTLLTMTWRELTVAEDLDLGAAEVKAITDGTLDSYRVTKRYRHADGHVLWGDLSVTGVRDDTGKVVNLASQITDVTAEVDATQQYRLLAENAGDLVVHIRDGRFAWVSPSCTDVIGGSPDYWVGRDATEITLPVEGELINDSTEAVESGGVVQLRHRVQALDGTIHWVQVHAKPFYAPDGREDGITAAMRVIDDEVAAEQAAEEARLKQARADARYRRSIDNAAVGMCMVTPEGVLYEANAAMCGFFGYDADEINGRNWRDFTAPEFLEEEERSWDGMLEGRIDSYRIVKHYHHRDGHDLWGYLSVSGIRDDEGNLEYCVALLTDITARVEADELNRFLAQHLQQETDRVRGELDSAADYMASIMPRGLEGPVTVSSRYLPSRQLGGDCLDYYWLDDDHLLVKLIDVSGHGLEPALLAASVHNLMRSGSLPHETLLSPEAVLTELNRLFAMEKQNGHYFTMWYGIYQASTRTLRYASAGAPPALAFTSATDSVVESTELFTAAAPVGIFEDTEFTSGTYHVPPGCRILIHSDGANEINLGEGRQATLEDFHNLASRIAASPDWSLDDLIAELRALAPPQAFEDDCSLIQLTFD